MLPRHTRITDAHVRRQTLQAINATIHGVGLSFKLDKAEEGYTAYTPGAMPAQTILVLASFDFAYYHQLELLFYDVVAHNLPEDARWPDHWAKDQLVLLHDHEHAHALHAIQIPHPSEHVVFAFNRGSHGDEQYFVAASGFSYVFETVFYYNRLAEQPLLEHERMVWWVSR